MSVNLREINKDNNYFENNLHGNPSEQFKFHKNEFSNTQFTCKHHFKRLDAKCKQVTRVVWFSKPNIIFSFGTPRLISASTDIDKMLL